MTKTCPSPTVPVLVLGTGLTALGVIRTFERRRIPAYVLSEEPDDLLTRSSRWFRPIGQQPRITTDALGDFLIKNNFLKRAVLMPCSDPWVEAVAHLPSNISTDFPSTAASPETTALFLDKGLLAQALTELDLPHPHTVCVSTQDDIRTLPDSVFVNAFFKPRNSVGFSRRFGTKGIKIRDRADATKWFDEIQQEGFSVMLQENIPGPPTTNYHIDGFIDRTRTVRVLFARRRLRVYPSDFGNTTYVVSIPIAEVSDALEALLRLLQSVGYRGIFSSEFKHDHRDGKFKLLEVNVRPWWYIEFAQYCNVDICGLAYNDALDQPLESINHYRTGQYCSYPYFDLQAYLDEGRTGQLFSLFNSWFHSKNIVFSWDDPGPALTQFQSVFSRYLVRKLGRMLGVTHAEQLPIRSSLSS